VEAFFAIYDVIVAIRERFPESGTSVDLVTSG
jgi:hypothetical protein